MQRREIEVKKGINSLELAEKKMEVLEEITYEKETVQLESDIKAAEVNLASQIDAYAVEEAKLNEIKEMIERLRKEQPFVKTRC